MEKDYFDLVLEDGSEKKMEILSIFKMENSSYNYIIYCELDKSHYYLAKYLGDEVVNLSTELTDKEYAIASKIFEGVVNKDEIRN